MVDEKKSKAAKPEPVRRSNRAGFFGLLFICAAVYVGYALNASYKVFEVQPFEIKPRPALKGPLALNNRLSQAERLLENKIAGPESIEIHNGKLYTGTIDGKIVEITDGKITDEYKLVSKCSNFDECGRPLGIRHLKGDEFVTADPYRGLLVVDMKKKTHKVILAANALIDGKPMRFADDLDLLDEETVLLSDCTSKWELTKFVNEMFELKPNGRILKVNLRTGGVNIVAKDLYFPNGVQLFPDKKSILIGESTAARLTRIYISGEKVGKKEVFVENLPGFPDNVRLSHDKKTFWVAFFGTRVPDKFSFYDSLIGHPLARRLVLALLDGPILSDIFTSWKQKHAMAIQVDLKGKIVSSLHDPHAKAMVDNTQVTEDSEYIYFGSYHSPYLGRLRK
ncbi:hypothetical protein L596_011811 [Steinernema carpocapsae]|uniref:Strictosidine synthase conserved region domain-containing protein n=1 Tax=Steinernema carpocapsae TaxID=34508 RepID=A0A4U5NV48_STECR|nr:hypothetical protein L596_011811 [Steinernema carpocapsae]